MSHGKKNKEYLLFRHAGGRTSDITLDLCAHIQNFSGLDVLMHITCTYMTREKVIESLDRVSLTNLL